MLLQILMYCRKKMPVHKLIVRSRLLSIVIPVLRPILMKTIITAHHYVLQDNCNAIKFYTGFPSFQLLMACFTFLGPAVYRLSYDDHVKLTKGKPHKLSPLNEFIDVMSSLTWFI